VPHTSKTLLVWFAVGLVLTTATQLRVGDTGVGIGEVLLSGWTLATAVALSMSRRLAVTPLLRVVVAFWTIAALALVNGFVLAPAAARGSGWLHDVVAFAFLAVVLIGFVAPGNLAVRFHTALGFVVTLAVVPMLLMWIIGLATPTLGPLNLWYYHRFVGWAQNPNQVALLMAPLPFLCAHLGRTGSGRVRWFAPCLALAAVWVGIGSDSDALKVAWAVSALALLTLWWGRLCVRGRTHVRSAILAYGLAPLVVFVLAIGAAQNFVHEAALAAQRMYDDGGQGAGRFRAWEGGLRALGSAPLFGRGPGAHSDSDTSSVVLEAHNTFVDWGASTGIVGLCAYLALVAWVLVLAWNSGCPALLAAIIALLAFSMFGYVLRQPIYWFYLLGTAVLSASARRPAGRSMPSMAPAARLHSRGGNHRDR
jgi:O-antigen ligase